MDVLKDILLPIFGPFWNLLDGLVSGLFDLLVECLDAIPSFLSALKQLPLELSNFADAIDPAGVGIMALVVVGFALLILRIILSIF